LGTSPAGEAQSVRRHDFERLIPLAKATAWLRAFVRWLAEPHLLWWTLLGVMLALAISLRPGANEFQIRASGLVLQWLGIGTVALGVRRTRRQFGLPSLKTLFHNWLARFPSWPRNVVLDVQGVSIGVSAGHARLEVWSNVDPSAPLEQQVAALAKNVQRVKESLDTIRGETDTKLREHSEALRREEQARTKSDDHFRKQLEAAHTGGIYITFAGVIWLLVGVFLATVAPEIAALWS